jgi:hypothetical protein
MIMFIRITQSSSDESLEADSEAERTHAAPKDCFGQQATAIADYPCSQILCIDQKQYWYHSPSFPSIQYEVTRPWTPPAVLGR